MIKRKKIITLLSALYLTALVVVLLLQKYVAEDDWRVMLLTYMAQPILAAPLIVLLPLALWFRKWAAVGTLTASVLLLVFVSFGYGLNDPLPPSKDDLRVMTFNIEVESHGAINILRLIDQQRPDIICMQEVGEYWQEGGVSNALLEGIRKRRYEVILAGQLLTASRYPVRSHRTHLAPYQNDRRRPLVTELDVEGKTLTVINCHLVPMGMNATLQRRSYTNSDDMKQFVLEKSAQVIQIINLAEDARDPVIVCGDFNLPSKGSLYATLCQDMTNTFEKSGRGFGFTAPASFPLRRIDHIFVRGLEPRWAVVPPDKASDHKALVSGLTFPSKLNQERP